MFAPFKIDAIILCYFVINRVCLQPAAAHRHIDWRESGWIQTELVMGLEGWGVQILL